MLGVALDNVLKRISHTQEPAALSDLMTYLSGHRSLEDGDVDTSVDSALLCGGFTTVAVVSEGYLEEAGSKDGVLDEHLLGTHFSHTVRLGGLTPSDVAKYARSVRNLLKEQVHKNLCSSLYLEGKMVAPKPILTVIKERDLINASNLGTRMLGVESTTGVITKSNKTGHRSLGIAEGVAAALLDVEGLSAMSKALSAGLTGTTLLAPRLAVLVVSGGSSQQLMEKVSTSCRGTMLRQFTKRVGTYPTTKNHTDITSQPPGSIPPSVGRFLFEALALAPVVVGTDGLFILHQAWAASQRLSDVATAFHSLVSPFENLRSCDITNELWEQVSASGAGATVATSGDIVVGDAPPASICPTTKSPSNRTRQLLGNAGAINVLYGHAAAVEERTGSLERGISVFTTMYELLCCKNWKELATHRFHRAPPEEGHICGDGFVAVLKGESASEEGVPDDVEPLCMLDTTHMAFPAEDGPSTIPRVRTDWFPPLSCPEISANRILVGNLLEAIQLVTQPGQDESEYFAARKRPRGPVLSADFYHPIISDAVRVLYVLVCHELRAKGQQGSWTSLQRLAVICCFGDPLRCLRAVYHLALCRTVQLNLPRLVVRSRCL